MNTLIADILKEIDYPNNPYFVNLKNGTFEKQDFIETQIQFYFAVIFFNRPMMALAAKIPVPELRLETIRNVWEEHGEGDLKKAHGHTFLEFLNRLASVTEKEVQQRALWPEVRIFNTTLSGVCVLDDFLIGLGVMGIIERMFCDISFMLSQSIMKNDWLSENQMIHYNLHKDLDIQHSQEFFDVLSHYWDKNENDVRYYIEQGLRMGATLFNNFYEGLYKSRKRRLERQFLGSHSRVDGNF